MYIQQFQYYRWQVPNYHYSCGGFLYYASIDPEWYVMDDFGNAVISNLVYGGE